MQLRTQDEWNTILSQVAILDPDGWDRQNFQYSFYEELISEEEYMKRLGKSTTYRRELYG